MQLIKGPVASYFSWRERVINSDKVFGSVVQIPLGDDVLQKQATELSASFHACLYFKCQNVALLSPSPWIGFKTLLSLRCCAKTPKMAFLDQIGISRTESGSTEKETLATKDSSPRPTASTKRSTHLNRKSIKRNLTPKVARQETLSLSVSELEKARNELEQLGVEEPELFKSIMQVAPTGTTVDTVVSSLSSLMGIARVGWSEAVTMLIKVPSLLRADLAQLKAKAMFLVELGMDQIAISNLLSLHPVFLEYDLDQMRLIVDYLLSVGIPPEDIPIIVKERPQTLNAKLDDVKFVMNCFLEVDIPPKDISRILMKVSELFSPETRKNLQPSLDFFKRIGLYGGSLGKGIARRPNLINFDLESMKQAHGYLLEFLPYDDVSKLCRRFAEVLVIDPKRKMEPMVNHLLRLGVKPTKLGKVLLRRPQLLGYTVAGLEPTLQYLQELGVKERMLGRVISISPQVLTLNCEEKLKPVVEYLRSLGLTEKRDMEMLLLRNAQLLCCSIEKNISPKFKFFLNIGLSQQDVVKMLVLFPSMFGQSIEFSLEPKYRYLVDVMKRSPKEIIEFPQYFGYSLEKRIKPRYEQLAARGVVHISLPSMLACVEADFVTRYLTGDPPSRAPYIVKKVPRKSKYMDQL